MIIDIGTDLIYRSLTQKTCVPIIIILSGEALLPFQGLLEDAAGNQTLPSARRVDAQPVG